MPGSPSDILIRPTLESGKEMLRRTNFDHPIVTSDERNLNYAYRAAPLPNYTALGRHLQTGCGILISFSTKPFMEQSLRRGNYARVSSDTVMSAAGKMRWARSDDDDAPAGRVVCIIRQ